MSNGLYRSTMNETHAVFEPVSWLIKMDFIHQFILNNNVLISVLGDSGSGKTTFAQLLQNKLNPHTKTALLTISPSFDRALFIAQLCSMLNLDDKLAMDEIIYEMNKQQSRAFILIDHAEKLPEAFVQELLFALKQQEGNGYVHVCLLSDFSIVKMTNRLSRNAYKEMIHSIELQPLSENETKAYVMARMASMTSSKVELTDEWLQQLYRLTEGNIAQINTQVGVFFATKPSATDALPKSRFRTRVYLSMVAMTAACGYFLYFESSSDVSKVLNVTPDKMRSVAMELPLLSELPSYQVASVHEAVQVASPQNEDTQVAFKPEAHKKSVNQLLALMHQVVPAPQFPVHVTAKSIPSQSLVVKTQPMELERASQKMVPVLVQSSKGAEHFTIQLLASRDKMEIVNLAKRYASTGSIKVRHFITHGVTWYLLTLGEYPDQDKAKLAIKSLPKQLALFNPWTRTTMNLQMVG